jgi:hypothetical protein
MFVKHQVHTEMYVGFHVNYLLLSFYFTKVQLGWQVLGELYNMKLHENLFIIF